MHTSFQTRNLTLDLNQTSSMEERVQDLKKFFSDNAHTYIDVEKTRNRQNGDDLYHVSIQIEDGKFRYFTEAYEEDVRSAFDRSFNEMRRMVREDKSKLRDLTRRAGLQLKKLFRRKK